MISSHRPIELERPSPHTKSKLGMPQVFTAASASTGLSTFVASQLPEIKGSLEQAGAVLLRGFPLVHAQEFAEVATLVGGPLGTNYEGPSPRTYRAPGVYTASEVSGA